MGEHDISELEERVFDSAWNFSRILGRLYNAEFYVSVKKFPSGITTFAIYPQSACASLLVGAKRYPDKMYLSEEGVRFNDISSPIQKKYIRYLQREIPGVKFLSEDS